MAIAALKRYISPQQRIYYGGMMLLATVVGIFFLPPELFIRGGFLIAASILFFTFLFHIRWGIYAMATFCFFSNWFVYLSNYSWTRSISYLSSIDAPLIDFIAIIVAISLTAAVFLGVETIDIRPLKFIRNFLWLYGGFVVVAIVAALRAYDNAIGLSLKYVARPIVFVVLLYVLLPLLLIRSKELLERVFRIWFWVGVAIALFGLSSLIVLPQSGWWMVAPYGINNLAPLGYNHNLIAEVLVAIIPIGGWLTFEAYRAGKEREAWWYAVGTSVIVIAELLTLSRAGWVSCAVEIALTLYLFRPYVKTVWARGSEHIVVILSAVGIFFAAYMVRFLLGSAVVSSSNYARLLVTEIAKFYFFRSPLIGYGPGTYVAVFQNTHEYVVEFGEALDAHGVIQKILLEEGLLGFLFFAGALAAVIRKLWRGARRLNFSGELMSVMLIMVAGALTFQLFNTSYFSSVMWMPIGVALAAAYLYRDEKQPVPEPV